MHNNKLGRLIVPPTAKAIESKNFKQVYLETMILCLETCKSWGIKSTSWYFLQTEIWPLILPLIIKSHKYAYRNFIDKKSYFCHFDIKMFWK